MRNRTISSLFTLAMLGCAQAASTGSGDTDGPGGKSDTTEQDAATGIIEGTVIDTWIGEVDPFAVGDACLLIVKHDATGANLGLVEDFEACTQTQRFEGRQGAHVRISRADMAEIDDTDAANELRDLAEHYAWTPAPTFYWFDGDVVEASPPAPAGVVRGLVEDTFIGEMDPVAVGDACVVILREGSVGPRHVLLEDFDACTNTRRLAETPSARAWVREGDLTEVTDADALAVLRDFVSSAYDDEPATFHLLTGDVVDVPALEACAQIEETVIDGCIDSSTFAECVPQDGDANFDGAMGCCAFGKPYCEGYGATVTAYDRPLPPGLAAEEGFLANLHVRVVDGERFTNPVLSQVSTLAQSLYGNECDGVPTGGTLEWAENTSVRSLISFLRNRTQEWSSTLSAAEIAALEAYVQTVGVDRFRVFYTGSSGEACGGSGEVSVNLIWNTSTDDVLYLVLYPYSE